MNLQEALEAGIGYETRARDLYRRAAEQCPDPAGLRLLSQLADDEEGHREHLARQLERWREAGELDDAPAPRVLPIAAAAKVSAEAIARRSARSDPRNEIEALQEALVIERDTSAFYRRVAGSLEGRARDLFKHFVEVEEGHFHLVAAQLDALTGVGKWFDLDAFMSQEG
jgi:rubrerythrin